LAEQYAAEHDVSFTRDRVKMFEDLNPVLQQKREQQGTRALAIQMSGRGPFDPTRDRIINGLINNRAGWKFPLLCATAGYHALGCTFC
jgi:hypothetical protein